MGGPAQTLALRPGTDPEVLRDEIKRIKARVRFLDFVKYTKRNYKAERVHEFVAERLQAFVEAVERGESPRLMLFMPPQEGKSELVSRRLPPWVLGNHPEWRVALVSYGAELAEDMSQDARRIVESEVYSGLFPDVKLDPTSKAVSDWTLDGHVGGMRAIGIGGAITGRSIDILIIDDPVKGRLEVDRDTYRDEQWAWWPQAVDRVQEVGGIIVLCTRWHHDDLPGRLLKRAEEDEAADQWEVIKLRAIADEDDPLGREPGEPLAPSRHSLAKLLNLKANMPERDWTAKFDQEPTPDEGSIFKRDWLRFEDAPKRMPGWVFQVADTAFSEKKSAAFTCVETWRVEKNCYRLLHVYRNRVDFPDLTRDVKALDATFHPLALVIEKKASGQSLIQVLSKETRLPVLPYEPHGDKVQRAHLVTPLFKAGRVVLPPETSAPWVKEWVKEHLTFPASEFKDQVDTTSMGLLWAQAEGWAFENADTKHDTIDFTWDDDVPDDSSGLYTDLGIQVGEAA